MIEENNSSKMYDLAKELFPICRSLTGNGVRDTLNIIKRIIPAITLYEVPTGTQVFDWTIPKEWNIKGGGIYTLDGKTVIDFKDNNLHILGYSLPVDEIITREELLDHIYTLPDQPDLIPYVTSYYSERWGFCMSENQKQSLNQEKYHIRIDSSLSDGSLTYGEVIIPGDTEQELFFSTYICHPSMANNELSGPVVQAELIKYVQSLPKKRYTYRFIFIPETIGSIMYISRHLEQMKKNIVAGFVLTCLGDNREYSYIESRYANTLADKVAQNVLKYHAPDYKRYSFLKRGSDERQYCSAGVELPVCSICRSKYSEYPEYHTSADNLDFISADGLSGAYEVYKQIINTLESNYYYQATYKCEPQLGKRGLYPTISMKNQDDFVPLMMDIIAYADGKNDLIDISNIIDRPVRNIIPIIHKLESAGLLIAQ